MESVHKKGTTNVRIAKRTLRSPNSCWGCMVQTFPNPKFDRFRILVLHDFAMQKCQIWEKKINKLKNKLFTK